MSLLPLTEPDSEWERIYKADPILSFCERVNNAALVRPDWRTDYARAHYLAFVEQAQQRFEQVLEGSKVAGN